MLEKSRGQKETLKCGAPEELDGDMGNDSGESTLICLLPILFVGCISPLRM